MNFDVGSYAIILTSVSTVFYIINKLFRTVDEKNTLRLENDNLKRTATLREQKEQIEYAVASVFSKMMPIVNEDQKQTTSTAARILTNRELQVAALLVDGLVNKEIAEKLKIAPSTVNNHVENMKDKTNSKNKAELVAFLVKNELV